MIVHHINNKKGFPPNQDEGFILLPLKGYLNSHTNYPFQGVYIRSNYRSVEVS